MDLGQVVVGVLMWVWRSLEQHSFVIGGSWIFLLSRFGLLSCVLTRVRGNVGTGAWTMVGLSDATAVVGVVMGECGWWQLGGHGCRCWLTLLVGDSLLLVVGCCNGMDGVAGV